MKKFEQKKWTDMSPEEKKKSKRESFIALIVSIPIIIGVLSMCSDDHSKYNSNLKYSAQSYASDLLEKQLNYPDGWEYESKAMMQRDSVTYQFTAVVLAKNGFGVRGRMLYNIKLEFIGSKNDSYSSPQNPGNWHILSNELVQ